MAESDVKQRLAAILAADVAGYTRLMADDQMATVVALDAARAVFREAIEGQDGRVVDMAGDSVLAVFETATAAVRAALAVQTGLADTSASDERRMRFRIGVHLGEVIEKSDGTIYGAGVNLAARLEGLAAPGGICISAAISDQIAGKIDETFEDIGEHRVKNVAKPVHALAWGGRSAAAPRPSHVKPTVALGDFTSTGGAEAETLAAGVKAGIATSLSNQTGVELLSETKAADYVISGTLQVHGSRYRASSRILDSSTGQHFAADRFEGSLEDPFAAEDELTYRVYNSIRFGLHRREMEMAHVNAPSADSDEALILQAATLMFEPEIENFGKANALLDRVLANSPDGFMPLAMKAMALCGEFFAGCGVIPEDTKAAALKAAHAAVRHNPTSDYAHWVLSMTLLACKNDHEAAEAAALLCLELNPYYAFATMGRGMIAVMAGRVEEGIALSAKVAGSDPRVQIVSWASQTVALGHLVAGRYREAVDWAERTDLRQSDVARTLLILASAAALGGDADLARRTAERMMSLHPDFRIADFGNWPFRDEEPAARLVEGLRLAGLPE